VANISFQDFNTAQRLAFCVFSGKGVSQLRTYLTELFDSITEMNNTDDTEYEEDEFDEGYQEDDTPEPETMTDVQVEDEPRQQMSYNNNAADTRAQHGSSLQEHGHNPPPHSLSELPTQQNPAARASAIYMPAHYRTTPDRAPAANLAEAWNRLETHIPIPASSSALRAPSIAAGQRQFRTVADALPIVESSASPSPLDTPGRLSAAASDTGGGFFRAHNDRSPATLSPRGNGALTPDLNFAEIGHGRGVQSQGASTTRAHALNRTPRRQPSSRPAPESRPRRHTSFEHISREMVSEATVRDNSRPSRVGDQNWTYQEPVLPNPVNRELHDYVQMAFDDRRGRQAQVEAPAEPSEPRSTSVRRHIKNTFHAAEHYANSLFHRSSGHVNESGDTTGNHPGTSGSNRGPRSR